MSDINKKSELDEYGVWVKKPPVDNTEPPHEETPIVNASFIEQAVASDIDIEKDLSDFDIESIGQDLKKDEVQPSAESETSEDTSAGIGPNVPNVNIIEETVDIQDAPDMSELNLDDFAFDETETVEDEAVTEDTAVEFPEEKPAAASIPSDDTPVFDEFPEFEATADSGKTFVEPAAEETADTSSTIIDENSFGTEPAIDPASFDTPQETSIQPESAAADFEDGEIDLDAFMSDSPSADSTPDGEVDLSSFMSDDTSAPGQDGDVDLSAFMGDSSFGGSGDIDLESFIGSEGFASDRQEQEEIEDADPLDIDLDFETTEVELQDAEATGEITEDMTSSYSASDSETEEVDFDAIFDDMVDETPDSEKPAEKAAPKPEMQGNTEEIDLSDFGFEDNSDNQNPILGDGKDEPKHKAGPVDYEMNVDDDENPEPEEKTVAAEENSNSEEDDADIELDISQDSGKAEQVEQETDLSSPDDSFDIDSILNSVEDENGGTVSFDGVPVSESTEVTDSEPMFQESVSEPVDETESEVVNPDDFINDETFVENAVAETIIDTSSIDSSENFIDTSDDSAFDIEPEVESASKTENFETENANEEKVENTEEFSEEFSIEEPNVENFEGLNYNEDMNKGDSSSDFSDEDISLEDFMGEEGFTDGGPGVTGPYNEDGTLIVREPKENKSEEVPEEPAMDSLEEIPEESTDQPLIDETSIEEPLDEEKVETVVEDDFAADINENLVEEAAEENIEEPEADMTDIANNEETNEPDYSNISAFADKKPEYDMTGITLTLDDFENIKEYPENPAAFEETSAQSPAVEETSVPEETNEENTQEYPEEPEVYSVFIKADSTSGNAEVHSETAEPEEEPVLEEPQMNPVHEEDSGMSADAIEESTAEKPVVEESEKSTEKKMDSFDSTSILEKISSELASLRSEIKDLKSEFEEIKKNGVPADDAALESVPSDTEKAQVSAFEQPETASEPAIDSDEQELQEPLIMEDETASDVELPEPDDDTGFFNDTDEDDTIALSGDELSNILNTAEFTSQNAESLDAGTSTEFDNDAILEEPVFDESMEPEAEETEEEISVPTVDDVLVESSSTDLMDNSITTEEDETVDDVITEDEIPAPTLESIDFDNGMEDDSASLEPEELTEGNIEYLKNDELSEDENLEAGISEQPVEGVFNNWESSSATANEEPELEDPSFEEPVVDEQLLEEPLISEDVAIEEPLIEEPAIEEQIPEEENVETTVEKPAEKVSNDIPSSMKEEIKSVLTYMDQLLENLPEDKIAEFAQSEQFETYKKLFAELGIS